MESNKVKLPKEVAEGLEEMKRSEAANENCDGYKVSAIDQRSIALISDYNDDVEALNEWLKPDGKLSIERCGLYYQALVNGYEVEQTTEDKVREIYKFYSTATASSIGDPHKSGYNFGARDVVVEVLDALNLIIEGVND